MARKVTDPLALSVKAALKEILNRALGPYSSARITGGTVHRTSWPIQPEGLPFMRYPSDKDLTQAKLNIINGFVVDVANKLSLRGLDMSKVNVGWHFGAGLYLNVRVVLEND